MKNCDRGHLYGHGKIIPTYLLINERKTSHKGGSSAVSYIALERELTKRKRDREEKKELLQHKIFVFGHSFKLETARNRDYNFVERTIRGAVILVQRLFDGYIFFLNF